MADVGFKMLGDNSHFRAMIDSSHNMVTKFGQALNLFGVGVGAAGVIGFFKNIVDKVGALQDLSDRLGVGTDALQSFDYAVRLAGGSSEQAVQAWDKGRKALDNLAAGNDAAVKQFRALGLSAKDFIGLNLEESLEVIASGYTDNVSAAGAYDAITDILGAKSAPALMTALTALGTEGFGAFIKGAKDAGQLIEGETIKKIDAFGDRLTTLKGSLQGFGATVLNLFLALGEDIGEMVAHQFNLWDGIETVQLSAIVSADKAVKAMDKMAPALEAQIDYEAKIAKIKEQQDAIADKALSRQDRISKLTAEAFALQAEMFNLSLSQGERNELNLKREGTITKLKGEVVELDKEQAKIAQAREEFLEKEVEQQRELLPLQEQRTDLLGKISTLEDGIQIAMAEGTETLTMEKKLAEARNDLRKVEAGLTQEQIELAKLLLKPTEQLTAEEKIRLDLLTGVTTQKQLDEEFTRLAAGAVAGTLLPAEKERLAALVGSSAEYAAQLASAAGITAQAKEFVLTLGRKGDSYEQQSTDALTGVRDRIKSQLDAARRQNAAAPRSAYNPIEVSLAAEYQQIMNELSARENVGDYANRVGEAKARGKYGDELVDRALRDLTDTNVRTTTAIEDIQQRLATLFPKK